MDNNKSAPAKKNAFCVDLEEWFHVCGSTTLYQDIALWDSAKPCVVDDTNVLLDLFDETKTKATFLTLGWIAEKYPQLVKNISDRGHEIGSHGYYHNLVFEQKPEDFRNEIQNSQKRLQDITGQPVVCFRAPGFSMRDDCFWAYEILAEQGIKIDISIVPAARDHGGIAGFSRSPFLLNTTSGVLTIFPVSVMSILGVTVPFSGGGYLRLFPNTLVRYGFRQNHEMGLPVMAYIHPREINPDQPRLDLPWLKNFKYYVGIKQCLNKLRYMLNNYPFTTVSAVAEEFANLPSRTLIDGKILEPQK